METPFKKNRRDYFLKWITYPRETSVPVFFKICIGFPGFCALILCKFPVDFSFKLYKIWPFWVNNPTLAFISWTVKSPGFSTVIFSVAELILSLFRKKIKICRLFEKLKIQNNFVYNIKYFQMRFQKRAIYIRKPPRYEHSTWTIFPDYISTKISLNLLCSKNWTMCYLLS